MKEVRVRFAPSPTGQLHLGNARTALFNWLFARHHGGRFILRIEDTDAVRSEDRFAQDLIEDLKWLGLDWDEGPEIGGEKGPYRQSERSSVYQAHAQRLLGEGKAYSCFCQPQELAHRRQEAMKRGEAPRYDNRCRNLTEAERTSLRDEGRRSSLRFKMSSGSMKFQDHVRGEVTFDLGLIGDFVIVKSDGMPTYHFAVCVDDALMKISHIIRGEDHLSNTPRHLALFEGLGFEAPEFVHLSMIGKEGGGRLSKREAAPSVRHYRDRGILPDALVNYLALLGWTPQGPNEVLTRTEIIDQFLLKGLTKSRAALDTKKMEFLSGQHIRKMDTGRLTHLLAERTNRDPSTPWFSKLVQSVQDHLVTLADIEPYTRLIEEDRVPLESSEPRVQEWVRTEGGRKVLETLRKIIGQLKEVNEASFPEIRKALSEQTGLSGGKLLLPVRAALTGTRSGPELHLVFPILGRDRILRRVEQALAFGGN